MTGTRASVYIKVGTSLEMVDDITPSTTVGEVTRRLSNARHRFKPQVLLEVWNGCSRLMHHEEFLLDSLNKWGNQIRTITFVMMDKERYTNESSLRIARNKGRRTTRQSCLRMSCRKRLAVRLTRKHKILLKSELKSKLRKELMQCREERRCLAEMIRGSSANQLRNEQAILSKLSPSLRLQHAGLSNEVAKISQSNEELERHKRELNQTLANRKQEIRSLQAAIESKQKQTKTIKQETKRIDSMREVKARHEDILASLKAKQKINQLQSLKLNELTSKKMDIERQIQQCVGEIQKIKIEENFLSNP